MKTVIATLTFCSLAIAGLHAEYEFTQYSRRLNEMQKEPAPLLIQTEEEANPKPCEVKDKRVVLQSLNGVLIAGEGRLPPEYVIRATKGVEFYRSMQCVEQCDRDQLRRLIEKYYLNRVLTQEKLEEIRCEIAKFYRKKGQALVLVSIPEQDVSGGIVVITVLESRLGVLNILGNCWFSEDRYRGYFSTCPGDIIFNRTVEADIAWINRSPWRKVCAIYKCGKECGTTDIDLCVRDERPINVYVGADNTGFKITNYNRIFTGIQWGNVFGLDHIFSYQFTTAPNYDRFHAHMVHYTAPLPWRHVFIIFGGYSGLKVKNRTLPANVHCGESYQISERYIIPLLPIHAYTHEVKVGLDWKRTNNDLVVGKLVVSKALATIVQLEAGYDAKAAWDCHRFEVDAELLLQPWHFGYSMSQHAYNVLRPKAANVYMYVKAGAHYIWQDPRTSMGVDIKLRGQVSTAPLLPIETLGLGGVYSVRGYPERVVNVDNGIIFNFEVRTPKLPICNRMKCFDRCSDGLAAVFFFDMGEGHIKKTVPGQPDGYFLAGIGPGLRYDCGHNIHARLDLGIRLTEEPFNAMTHSKTWLHFGVIASY